jgi:hypothetical protein
MNLPTLDAFLAREGFPTNSFVQEPGFKLLYVRKNRRFLNGKVRKVIDIARVEAEAEGAGTFTRLCERLLARGLPVYVECVETDRFEKGLLRLGFSASETSPHCFYKLPLSES